MQITTLKDLVRWLAWREQVEEELQTPERERIAQRWTIFPFQGAIYVGVATGLTGQQITNKFPELNLPVSLPEQGEIPEELKELPFEPTVIYFGPFSQEQGNLT